MIKDLVVNLSVDGSDVAAAFAISVAETFGAHVAGVAFSYDAIVPPTIMSGVPASYIDQQRDDADKAANDTRARFDEAAKRAGVSAESRALGASLAGAAEQFSAIARRFDLSVIAQAEPGKVSPEELMAEGALFGSGRPILIVPYIQTGGLKLDRVMVCWDGGRQAARAVADAMPFLMRAKVIDVVIVTNDQDKGDEVPGADIGQHLARHGLNVEVKRIVATDTDVASMILSHAADTAADFIVMGGYGHSRLREFVLGGVTRGVLTAMPVPVLLSH